MGVAYHSHFVVWFEAARGDLIRSLGLSYRDVEKMGVMMPVAELQIKFMRPAFYDDLLRVVVTVNELPERRLKTEYEVFNEKDELLCTGMVILAFINSETRRPVPAPPFFLDVFKKQESSGNE